MVGRMEIMTPKDEARIAQLVHDSAAVRAAAKKHNQVPPGVPEAIRDLGRLAEPALLRVGNISKDATVRTEAGVLFVQLRRERQAKAK